MLTLGAAGLLFQTGLIILSFQKRHTIPVEQLQAVFTKDEVAILVTTLAIGSKKLLTDKINEKVYQLFTEDECDTLREEIKSEEDPHLYLLNKIIERMQQNQPKSDAS